MNLKISDIMTTHVVTLDRQDPVTEAAKLMSDNHIGDVLITDETGHLAGVVTDRDLVVRVVAEERNPDSTALADVATEQPVTIQVDDPVTVALELMRNHAVRRLPVVSRGRLVGIVSLGDLAVVQDEESVLAQISVAAPSH